MMRLRRNDHFYEEEVETGYLKKNHNIFVQICTCDVDVILRRKIESQPLVSDTQWEGVFITWCEIIDY